MTPSEKRLIRAERRADELITISEYDPRWPALFDSERRDIAHALGDVVAIVGSPGTELEFAL